MKTKRILSALLSLCLTLSLVLPATAAGSAVSLDEALQAVTALGIMSEDGAMSQRVTRAQFITMAIKASPGGDGVGQAATSPYPDVPRSHWASGYVEAGVARGLISGFSDGTFRPDQEVKLAEAVSIVLALLGYGPEDFSGAYPSGQMAMFHSLKLDRGVSASGAQALITRQDAVYLFYDLLSAKTREGTPYIQLLGHALDASGKPDLVSLINGEMEGPVVAQGSWKSSLSFAPAKVYRNGDLASLSAVQDYDVIYWNEAMDTLWAYARKATGPIQAIEPDRAAPVSVTVAGRTYAIESSAAAYALSDLGQYHLGDTVTLLLGRSGGAAAVADVSASAGERAGVVVEVSNAVYPDGSGGTYTAQTVTLLATDGQTYQYQTKGSQRAGSLVRAIVSESGEVTLRGLSSGSLTGRVDSAGTKVDKYRFAQDVEILDVSEGRGAVLYPKRLAGLSLDSGKVRWYSLNAQGEIQAMILNDVTGDAYQYGILTRFEEQGEDSYKSYTYEFDLGGQTYAIPGTGTRYPVTGGAIQVVGDPASPTRIRALTAVKSGELAGKQYVAGSQRYSLADDVAVYELRGGKYYLSSLARAEESGKSLTAWYDKPETAGGRIRVILFRAE